MRSVYNFHFSTYFLSSHDVPNRVQVVDHVLKEPGVSDQNLYNRARGLLLLGAIFKSTIPDESDEERRELERCVPLSHMPSLILACRLT